MFCSEKRDGQLLWCFSILRVFFCPFPPDVILDRLKTKQEAELEDVKRRAAEEAERARLEAKSVAGDPAAADQMNSNGSCPQQDSSNGTATNEQTSADGERDSCAFSCCISDFLWFRVCLIKMLYFFWLVCDGHQSSAKMLEWDSAGVLMIVIIYRM